ncbi:MAG TPA: DUF507 family protein [Dongiaceae bacterium]|jgi:hypothetical protein|nr:DUF507 family protein [Dongiaceae bacterium]
MRLTDAKIRYLAARMVQELGRREDVSVIGAPETVESEIAKVIRENMLAEDALDRDVEKMMERYRREIASGNMDVELLRQKMKKQLAKERGMVF